MLYNGMSRPTFHGAQILMQIILCMIDSAFSVRRGEICSFIANAIRTSQILEFDFQFCIIGSFRLMLLANLLLIFHYLRQIFNATMHEFYFCLFSTALSTGQLGSTGSHVSIDCLASVNLLGFLHFSLGHC